MSTRVRGAPLTGVQHIINSLTFKAVDAGEDNDKRFFKGIATTIGEDRYGDIVESEGAQFNLPIALLWQHRSDMPVGQVTKATTSKKDIKVEGYIAKTDIPGTLKDRLDTAWQELKLGLVRFLSIGFNPLEYNYMEESYGIHFLKWEWLELSLVTIPANADSSITSIKRFDEDLRRAASGNTRSRFDGVPLVKLDVPGVSGSNGKPTGQRKAVQLIKS